tara:strand:- start:992 stop:2077 length:1086 start_codon:yes stop_codon:yes gene_type:complete
MNQQINEDKNTTKPESYSDMIAQQIAMQEALLDEEQLVTSFIPGLVSSVATDTAGAANVLLPRGDNDDYGILNYFSSVFDGSFSGKEREGEMFLTWDQIEQNPNLKEWLDNSWTIMKSNAASQLDKFREDNNISEEEFGSYISDLRVMDPNMEDPNHKFLNKALNQFYDPKPFLLPEEGSDRYAQGIIITQDTLPDIAGDIDPKFTVDGDLSLPYAGLYGFNDEGEFGMKRPSMFRFTDEFTGGKEGPAFLEAAEDYLYPNINARFSYGDSGTSTAGYMAGQVAPIVKSIATGAPKLVKKGYNYFKGKNAAGNNMDYSKIEPYFKGDQEGIAQLGGFKNIDQMKQFYSNAEFLPTSEMINP